MNVFNNVLGLFDIKIHVDLSIPLVIFSVYQTFVICSLQVERVMKLSLREVTSQAVEAYVKNVRTEWVLNWPGQVVLAASTIHWTGEVTEAINKSTLESYLKRSNQDMHEPHSELLLS